VRQVLAGLSLSPTGGNYRSFYLHVERLGLDISHFTGQGYLKGGANPSAPSLPLETILVPDSRYTNFSYLKKRLLAEGMLQKRCYECGLTEWRGHPITLRLDHVNGDNRDHRAENLRLLCPNCDSQMPTYCGRNKGQWSRRRRQRG
jgi:hypothetical protein